MISRTHQLTHVVDRFSGQPILVVGDLILDQFVWGRVKRISPEAPVPVVEVTRETVHLGGAANVAANLAALGAQPILVGLLGRDEAGRQLIEELENQGIATDSVVQSTGVPDRETQRRLLEKEREVPESETFRR